jgi:CHAT domain-containing protein/tetratricopeptide (TPR) repeat protein
MTGRGAADRSAASRWVQATLALALLLLPASAVAETENLDKCAAKVRDSPEQLESYMCYWFAARKGEADGADRALQELLSVDPGNHRARLYLGAIRSDRGDPSAESLYREAADGFAEWGEPTGEVYALLSLCHFLQVVGRPDEADEVLERAVEVATQAGEDVLLARAVSFQASRAMWRGAYGEALRLLRRAERAAFPDGPVDVRAGILGRMGEAYWAQGLLERAREAYTREADLMAEAGDPHVEAVARLNVAFVSDDLVKSGRIEREEIIKDLEYAVQAAHQIGDPNAEARARLLLASWSEPNQAVAEIERSREIYEQTGNRRGARLATRRLAAALWHLQPEWRGEALRLIDEAIEDARLVGDLQELARGLNVKAGMLQDAVSREEWVEAYGDVFEAIEKIRDLQPSGTVGARLFSRWTSAYYRFTGGLLRGMSGSPDPAGDLELAFHTIERMRARSLLDEMDGAGAEPPTGKEIPEAALRKEVLHRIAEIQKRLADPELSGTERTSSLEELERLETEEALLRDALARVDPVFAAWRAPTIPTIEEVRRVLAPDQAVLSFQLAEEMSRGAAPVFRGGSWVVAVTHDEARVFALPEERAVRELVTIFLGLCRRRDGSEAAAGTRLFEELLAEPLQAMGPSARRLVLVPDGALHALPFAALRPRADADPLGVTHEIARTPSVTLWMRWRDEPRAVVEATGRGAVLALADPELPGGATPDTLRAAKPWIEGLSLGSLPHARAEARALVRSLDGDSHLAYGAEASERFLKQAELERFRILHLATHAVVDDDHPERSAVVLTPGDEEEDGFLQVREIVELDVRNKVVILSSCRSASGTVLRGEGVQGLAGGFLQAGARGVVGNLWPLRDDDAELLVRELGRGLGRGHSIAAALAEARAARVEAGAPAAAWAGLVLLGDGDFAPISARNGWLEGSRYPIAIPLGILILAGLAVLAWRKLRA